MSILHLAARQLDDAGYSVAVLTDDDIQYLAFEGDTILGFVLAFDDAGALIERWHQDSKRVLKASQFGLRRAETKAWNAYVILLTDGISNYASTISLGAIEEDLMGTRKIARAGVSSEDDMRAALLPLLNMQHAPRLDAVDMSGEIRLRTSELPSELIDAFVGGAPDATILQLLEASQ
ncbi:hypothetical protein IGS74_03125 [Aureimonas sp. OT7]|uniref:hypothetical protein n=1 Tax=Aureimonas sp. OT7 TaxID=2816454 RepID=UPI00177A7EDF|nr:hypothetical protein [Aureimonas sp. OT7]QOG07272.1 hypothetical protein IGS74_03125 [Aureimonas sp. OT7]